MKSVLISIQKPHTDNIKSIIKTVEVRKGRPQQETPFPCYIYETKTKGGCGKVIGEFVCDRIDELPCGVNQPFWLKEKTCIDNEHYKNYLGNKNGYGWHISDLKIYDKPKELSEFSYPCPDKNYDTCYGCKYFYHDETEMCCKKGAVRPPRSWGYVEELK